MSVFPNGILDLHVDLYLGGAWVDMSERLTGDDVNIDHGRADETSQVQPSTLNFRLRNHDGAVTPRDYRSAWWIDRNVPCRARVGSTVLFSGELSSITPDYPTGDISHVHYSQQINLPALDDAKLGESFVNFTAAGILRRLTQGPKPLRSPLQRLVTSPTNLPHVQAYWSAEDGQNADFVATSLPATRRDDFPALDTIGFTLASDSDLPGSDPLPNVSSGADASWSAHVTGNPGKWTLDLFLHIPEPLDATEQSISINVDTAGGSHVRWSITIGWDGTHPFVRLRSYDALGAIVVDTITTDPARLFGAFVEMRLDVSDTFSGISWAITWSHVTTGTDIIEGGGSTSAGTVGHPTFLSGDVVNAPPGGFSLGHIILHDGIAGGWLVPADVGWQDERALTRLVRLCGEEGIAIYYTASSEAADFAGAKAETSLLGTQKSQPLATLLQEAADADYGILREKRDALAISYLTRKARYNRTPVLVLDAQASQLSGFTPTLDDQTIRNSVAVERIGGAKRTLVDPVSSQPPPVGVGVYDESISLSLSKDEQVLSQAGWRLHVGTNDALRFPQITLDLATGLASAQVFWGGVPALWDGVQIQMSGTSSLIAQWLTARVGDRLQVINPPPQHPIDRPIDLVIEGWRETLSPTGWIVTINCSPADPWDVAVWGPADGSGRWSPKDAQLVSNIDATQTSFSVITPGLRWTTDSAEFPFDLRIGAEVMQALSISGTGHTQTFTVGRNINRLGRAHLAGAEVLLATPAILAL